jgi:hypothetical protein
MRDTASCRVNPDAVHANVAISTSIILTKVFQHYALLPQDTAGRTGEASGLRPSLPGPIVDQTCRLYVNALTSPSTLITSCVALASYARSSSQLLPDVSENLF